MNKITNQIPTVGILCFSVLYIYASSLYPGGSQADLNTHGFDWINNYWCNLMDEFGMNGEYNLARPYSIIAMISLCISLATFFFRFANTFVNHDIWRYIIKLSGLISMLFAIFIFTEYHDLLIMVSSAFGLIAVVGVGRVIYQSDMVNYKIAGLVGLILLLLNNYIYYTNDMIMLLPLIQKFTFVFTLSWVIFLNSKMNAETI